ncbi:unnamed protein product [Calypogeia fissa]
MEIESLNASHAITEQDLRRQIIEMRKEAAAKEYATACLEKQLSQTISPDRLELKLKETERKLNEKYLAEQAELRKSLVSEEMRNEKLQADLKEAQQSLITWKLKHEDQLREMSANRHADVFKQKVMKLRKDNEVLKRQLQDLQKHK